MPQPWSALFKINQNPLMELNLQDITQAMADRPPAQGVNSVTWLLTHILTYRLETLAAVQAAPFNPTRPEPRTLQELMAAIGEVQTALDRAFDAVEDWSVAKNHTALKAPKPLDEVIGAFLVHDAYHAGQLALTRRLLGLPGVLKDPMEKVPA